MFSEDLGTFFDDDELAVAATFGGTTAGNVILDQDYLRALGMVSSANPTALARASEYGTSCVDGTLVTNGGTGIYGGTYVIRDRQPQDDGAVVLLQLERL